MAPLSPSKIPKQKLILRFFVVYGWIAFLIQVARSLAGTSEMLSIAFPLTLLFMWGYPWMPNIERDISELIRNFADLLSRVIVLVPIYFWFLGIFFTTWQLGNLTVRTLLPGNAKMHGMIIVPVVILATYASASYPMMVRRGIIVGPAANKPNEPDQAD